MEKTNVVSPKVRCSLALPLLGILLTGQAETDTAINEKGSLLPVTRSITSRFAPDSCFSLALFYSFGKAKQG